MRSGEPMLPSSVEGLGGSVIGAPEEFEVAGDFMNPRHGIASGLDRRSALPLIPGQVRLDDSVAPVDAEEQVVRMSDRHFPTPSIASGRSWTPHRTVSSSSAATAVSPTSIRPQSTCSTARSRRSPARPSICTCSAARAWIGSQRNCAPGIPFGVRISSCAAGTVP